MPRHLFRAIAPALSVLAAPLLLGGLGCGRVADRVQERLGTTAVKDEVVGEDWPPTESDGLELPPWVLPPILRGQGGGPPTLDPDHDLLPSPLGGPGDLDDEDEDLDDEGLASPPDEERGHEDFL